uniref:Transmembrane protein 151B n=1 Tax=Ditylenchus dipsaci TaxID=166011 RepID=A0A915DZE1_9BILA
MVRHTTQHFDTLAQQKPVRHGLCRTLHKDFHWKCLLSTLLVHLCISYTIWCHLKFYAYAPENAAIYSYAHVLLYLVYVTECWHFRTKLNAIPKRGVGEVKDLVDRMRGSTPIVWWKSVCYHYLRRTRQVTRYRNGDAITATQVYYERVNSHSSGNVFLYDCCGYRDISKELVNLDKYPVIRMKFTKGFVFACLQAANEFEEQRTRFFNENEVRDDYMEVREGLDLVDVSFTEHLLVYPQSFNAATTNTPPNDESDPESPLSPQNLGPLKGRHCEPWFMSSAAYWIASILLLSWPLRMLAEWKTAHLSYQVTKLFGTNYLSPSSVNYTGPLTRTSTMETCELELANRQNYLIVPSYSEAILLDPLMMSSANGVPGLGIPPPIPSIRSEFLSRNEPLTSSNEAAIIANYGSIGYSSYSNNSTDASTSFANTLSQRLFGSKPGSQYQPLNGHRPIRLDNLIEGVSYSANHRHFPLTQEPGLRPSTKRKITKSRSMSFFNSKNPVRRPNPPLSSAAVPLPRPSKLTVNTAANTARDYKNARKPPVRSISISGAISSHVSADNAWSNGQAVVPGGRFESGMDRRPLLFDQCSSNKAGATTLRRPTRQLESELESE